MGTLGVSKPVIAICTAAALIFASVTQPHAAEAPRYLTAQSLAGWKDYGGRIGLTFSQGRIFDLTVNSGRPDAYRIKIPSEYVQAVTPHGPADYAGIHPGDEILSLDNNYFDSVNTAVTYIDGQSPTHVVEVTLERDGKVLFAKIPLASVAQPHAPANNNSSSGALGAALGLGAVVVAGCWLFGCFSGGSSGSSSGTAGSSSSNDDWKYRSTPSPSYDEPARPDTSTGCAWGDRAYGTCH